MKEYFPNQNEQVKGDYFSPEFASELKRFYSKGSRASGRSTILAKILVETAIETGEIIYINDHHLYLGNARFNDDLFRLCENYIHDLNRRGINISWNKWDKRNNLIQLSMSPSSLHLYKEIRIKDSQNVFPVNKIKERIQELNEEYYKLLLII